MWSHPDGMSARNTVLILGGSHAEIPLITSAQRMGVEVVTTGNRPHDLGHPFADRYVEGDFSNRDHMLKLAMDLNVVGVVAGCNDFAALSAAYVAETLDLPGHDPVEVAERVHLKHQFRTLQSELGLLAPGFVTVSDVNTIATEIADIRYPVLVKPVDLTGGKGISLCHDVHEVLEAMRRALAISRSAHLVVEEFIQGSRHGFTCFVKEGRIQFSFADDEQYFHNPYLVSGTSTPSTLSQGDLDVLGKDVETIVEHLGLVDGLMHAQCVRSDDGPILIEICRRCPGDLYPLFVQHSTGFQYADAVVGFELGQDVSFGSAGTERPVIRHCMMGDRNGVVRDVQLSQGARAHLVDELTWWKPGDQIHDHLRHKLGILFLEFDDVHDMTAMRDSIHDEVEIFVAPVDPSRD